MKIIIAGAGATGYHLAKLLTREAQDIILIDLDEHVLRQAQMQLDVMTVKGDVTSVDILEQVEVHKSKLFIAVTSSEKTNLLSAMLAKELGSKKTIARISNIEYLKEKNRDRFSDMGVDILISPQQLAAQEIGRLLQRGSFTDVYEFDNGIFSIVGFTVDPSSPLLGMTIEQVDQMTTDFVFTGIALLRNNKTFIPERKTILRRGDHLYISTPNETREVAMKFVGKQLKPIQDVMIVGGTSLALRTAQQLEDQYAVTVVLEDEEMAKHFVSRLNKTLVVHADPSDVSTLKEEGLEKMQAFIALTPNSETNIITSLLAEEIGVYKTIALVENVNYTHISQNIGIDTIINKKLIAANNIFRFVRKGKVEAIAGLHGVDAEIIEFEIHRANRITRHPIGELRIPNKAVVAGVVRGERGFVPDRETLLELGDHIIVFALPDAIRRVEEIFK